MGIQKTILVAPLHWGLGHATRCIPIIKALLAHNFKVILASDGAALVLLQKEFPSLSAITLPSYNITYSKNEKFFKWSLLLKLPQIKKTIASENKIIRKLLCNERIDGIISDNRFGVRSKKVPSVIITHQLNVLSGTTTFFSSKLQQRHIRQFDECWVPDVEKTPNLSGALGHLKHTKLNVHYMGPLSRMEKNISPIRYDVLALLSGPEPQRTMLEEKLIAELKGMDLTVLLVQGLIADEQMSYELENIMVFNYMNSAQLEKAINESEIVVSRSGYTTIMDLAAMDKKAFFIPTPGQYEQKYLAKRFKSLGLAPCCSQEDFSAAKLEEIKLYAGLNNIGGQGDFKKLFCLFNSE